MNSHEENYEKEVTIKELLFPVLKRWRRVIVVSVLFAILLGGYRFYTGLSEMNDVATRNSREAAYQDELAAYNNSKETLESEISYLELNYERQRVYNDNSVLMQIDPFHEYIAIKNYYLSTDAKSMEDMTYQGLEPTNSIIQAYLYSTVNGGLYDYIREQLSYDMELQYLKELITIEADYTTKTISLQVVHKDYDHCQEIYKLVTSYFDQLKDSITETVGEHRITFISESIQSAIDIDLDNTQKNNILALANYENSLKEKQNALNSLSSPVHAVDSNDMIIKSTIKYAGVGFVLGMFLTAGILLFGFLTSNKLLDAKDLRPRYNLRVLGNIEKPKKKRVFGSVDRFISRLEGTKNILISESEAAKRIASNLKAICELEKIPAGSIVVTGTIDFDEIKDICNKLDEHMKTSSYKLVPGDNISYSADTILKAKEGTGVLVVEKLNSSTYPEITKQLETIRDLEKNVLGFILI